MPPTKPLLIQVVAQLKPERCGVSDHAISLAWELETAFGVRTAFAVVNSTERFDLPFPRVYCKQSELLDSCITLSEGRPAALLVHLSGYGFSKDGAPVELAAALAKVRADGRFHSAVYFHELYATGLPWRSAFWYSHRQKQAVRRIASECDLLVTNMRRSAEWLGREAARRSTLPIQLLPVFSNVGEAEALTPMARREASMAIFGLTATRQRAYRQLASSETMLKDLGVEEILDIGPEFDAPADTKGIPVRRMGVLGAADLGNRLSHSMFGFVQHSPPYLAKSGVLAGFSAQGTIPVVAKAFAGEVDGLRDGVHLVSPRTAKAALAGGLERCSAAAWHWYSGHRLHAHAATYAQLLVQQSAEAQGDLSAAGGAAEHWTGHASS